MTRNKKYLLHRSKWMEKPLGLTDVKKKKNEKLGTSMLISKRWGLSCRTTEH